MRRTFLQKKKKKRASPILDMPLQITSMADIFMILLVFLLKSYAPALTTVAPSRDVRLPVAASADAPRDAVKLEIAKDSITLGDRAILPLKDFELPPEAVTTPNSGPLATALSERRNGGKSNDGKSQEQEPNHAYLLVLADERCPAATIKGVLATAAVVGYADVQLMVVKEE